MLLSRLGPFPELRPGLERTDDDLLRRHLWPRPVQLLQGDDRTGLERWSQDLVRWSGSPDDPCSPDGA
jgi:hypothetical protein